MVAAAEAVRVTLEGGRSDRLLRLFDYLLAKSLAGETPSEQQIATDAFFADSRTETGQDANVRVYVHRLRKALEAAAAGSNAPALHIPVGEYRIYLIDPADADAAAPRKIESAPSPAAPARHRGRRTTALIAAALAAVLAAVILGWWSLGQSTPPLARTLAWQALDESRRPLVVVVGDYYLYAKLDGAPVAAGTAPQLVWDKDVPAREDLTIVQMLDPAQAHTVVDYNQQFVTSGTIEALSALRTTLAALPSLGRKSAKLVAASQLTPEMLKSSDIIFVGQFSGLPALLREPLSQASGFRIEPGFDGLTDLKNAKQYRSDGMVLTDERISRRDFAYLAGIPGPAGNRLLVIAGIGDAGVKEAAQLVGTVQPMQGLAIDSARQTKGFEALYRVRTIKTVNVGATPVLDRPLRSTGIWDMTGNVQPYRPFDDSTAIKPQP